MHEETSEKKEEETEMESENDSDPDDSLRQKDLINIQNKTYKMFLDIMHYWPNNRNERNLKNLTVICLPLCNFYLSL